MLILFLGIMMDACIRNIDASTKEVKGIACISFLKDDLLHSADIQDVNVDAYVFLTDASGNNYFSFCNNKIIYVQG